MLNSHVLALHEDLRTKLHVIVGVLMQYLVDATRFVIYSLNVTLKEKRSFRFSLFKPLSQASPAASFTFLQYY